MIYISNIFKSFAIHLRRCTKFSIVTLIGLAIIGVLVFAVYQPMYSVSLNGEFIGYTKDKRKLQKRINEYIQNGDSGIVAFVEIDTLPEYSICLLKKDLVANDDEIFSKVISSGIPYYKYYAIMDNNEEKYYVSSFEEAENIVQSLKDKNSNNKESITYAPKYETELKEFTDVETTVAALYVEVPKVVKKKTKVNTSKEIDYSNTALGIALIRPVAGTITSRFGSRSRGMHTGLDIATSSGTPIQAAAAGTVVYSGYKGSYGNLVVIAHNDTVQTYYAHCSKLYVNTGDVVSQGQVIAAVGSTGNSTGPHLHLEIRVNGVAKNPQNYLY